MFNAYNRAEIKDKAPTLSTGSMVTSSCAVNKFEKVAEPIRVGSLPRPNGELSQSQAFRVYDIEGKSVNLTSGGGGAGGKTGLYAVPLKVGEVNGGGQGNRIYSVEGKAVSQTATSGGIGSNTGLYAIPVEFENDIPVKAMSYADGKTYQVYEVKRGSIGKITQLYGLTSTKLPPQSSRYQAFCTPEYRLQPRNRTIQVRSVISYILLL